MLNRINLIMRAHSLSATQFADEIGVQRSNISHILSGRNNPSLEFVMKVLNRFPDISTDWLLLGKGVMYKTSELVTQPESIKTELPADSPVVTHSQELDLFSQIPAEEPTKPIEKQFFEPILEPAIPDPFPENNILLKEKQNAVSQEVENSKTNTGKILDSNAFLSKKTEKTIVKFIILYSDKTFAEYFPE